MESKNQKTAITSKRIELLDVYRGFAILDPNGIQLYIYSNIEPSEEFKQYYK